MVPRVPLGQRGSNGDPSDQQQPHKAWRPVGLCLLGRAFLGPVEAGEHEVLVRRPTGGNRRTGAYVQRCGCQLPVTAAGSTPGPDLTFTAGTVVSEQGLPRVKEG